MRGQSILLRSLALCAGSAAILVLCLAGPAPQTATAYAEAPEGEPTFENPTEITNPFFPVVPGAIKVHIGRDSGTNVTIVESHLEETRDFEWDGKTVTCRIVQEHRFESGALVETELKFFAQADNGTVYKFGETEDGEGDEDEPGDEDKDESGWIVGQRQVSDPPDVLTGASPAVFMPAAPLVGDSWRPENTPPSFVEIDTVVGVGIRLRVPAGRYFGCLRVERLDPVDGSIDTTWYAPGTGPMKSRARGERLRLQASTLLR